MLVITNHMCWDWCDHHMHVLGRNVSTGQRSVNGSLARLTTTIAITPVVVVIVSSAIMPAVWEPAHLRLGSPLQCLAVSPCLHEQHGQLQPHAQCSGAQWPSKHAASSAAVPVCLHQGMTGCRSLCSLLLSSRHANVKSLMHVCRTRRAASAC